MEQPNAFILILILFMGSINIIMPVSMLGYTNSIKEYAFSPNWIYKNSSMNKISCYIIAILFGIFNFVWSSVLLIYWLTHIGRELE